MTYLEFFFIIYFLIGILLIESNIKYSPFYIWYITFIIFISLKWLFNYRKCTISYLEVKLRGIKKEYGYINTFLEKCMELRESKVLYLLYLITIIIIIELSMRESVLETII